MIFFTDENISYKAAELLSVFDRRNEIRAHKNYFDPGTPDLDWLGGIAKWTQKPAVICGDGRILRNKAEMAALRSAGLHFIFLARGWTNMHWSTFAWKIIRVWPSIVANIEKISRPTIFEISAGTLKVERKGLVANLGRK